MRVPSVVFAIPLIPRVFCSDWELVQTNLRRTIRSIHCGISQNYRVAIACNDTPELGDVDWRKIDILTIPLAESTQFKKQSEDKAFKRRVIGSWIRERLVDAGVYCMLLDADDLVSRDVVEYVTAHDNRRSYIVDQGYLYDWGTKLLHRQDTEFDLFCGSCFIGYFDKYELPVTASDLNSTFSRFGVKKNEDAAMVGHLEYARLAADIGKQPDRLPFPAVVYLANHPESLRLKRLGRRRMSVIHGIVPPNQARSILTKDFSAFDLASSGSGTKKMFSFARGLFTGTVNIFSN